MFASPLELAFFIPSFSITLHPFRFFRNRFRTQFLPLLLLPPFPSRFLPNGEPFRLTIDGGALYVAVHALTEGQKSLSPPRAFPLASHIALGPATALLPLVLNYHHHQKDPIIRRAPRDIGRRRGSSDFVSSSLNR